MTEKPKVGECWRLAIEGKVTRVSAQGAFIEAAWYGNEEGTWERLPDPEPAWKVGDVVMDAAGLVYLRTLEEGWTCFTGGGWAHVFPTRPLRRMVPEVL